MIDTLLIVEDTPSLARTYVAHLQREYKSIQVASTGAEARSAIQAKTPDCVLLDLKLPDIDGLALLDHWVGQNLPTPIIVLTANGSMSIAVDAMRRGAADFIVKPTTADRLRVTLKNARENFRLKKTVETYEAEAEQDDFSGIIGRSLIMQGVYKAVQAAAPSRASVFVTGETGTGKELIAHAIHDLSPRRGANFVALNCAAIPKDLIESEIFGHKKGAFTGSTSDRVGAAQLADGGTLFLDELGEMPIELQPKLLRFLQLGEYSRVGETQIRRSNSRFVAATNRDPLNAVREGKLREDLYYRLHVIPIALPPLRERGADILLLANAFLQRFAKQESKSFETFSQSAKAWLMSHVWPGNVRELENLIHQLVVLNDGGIIDVDVLPALHGVPSQSGPIVPDMSVNAQNHAEFAKQNHVEAGLEPLWLTEKKAIERAIALCDGNIVAAARRLEINASTIYRKKLMWSSNKTS